MNLPKYGSYGNYSSDNYGAHCQWFEMNGITVYFSYKTPVAYEDKFGHLVVRKNDWSTTTGKHLNWIDNGNKKDRIDGDKFEQQLQALL
jgi:hypothetical protein